MVAMADRSEPGDFDGVVSRGRYATVKCIKKIVILRHLFEANTVCLGS